MRGLLAPHQTKHKSCCPLLLHLFKIDYYEDDGNDSSEEEDDADEDDDDDEADLLAEQVEVTEGGPDTSAGAPPSKFCLQ